MNEENKMYNYLLNHNYISENKKSNYQSELSIERAECIANKFNSLVEEENANLKQALKEIREYVNGDKLLERLCEPKINNKGETHFDLIREDILRIINKAFSRKK